MNSVARDGVRHVRLLEPAPLVVREPQSLGCESVVEVCCLRGADDRGGDPGLVPEPGERDLRRRYAALCRELLNAIDHGLVELRRGIERIAERVRFRAPGQGLTLRAAVAG